MRESDPIELNIKGLVLSWQLFDGERLLVTVMDLSSPIGTYSIEAFRSGRAIACQERLRWHEVERFVSDLVRARGDAPDIGFWEAAVQKLKGGKGEQMTRV